MGKFLIVLIVGILGFILSLKWAVWGYRLRISQISKEIDIRSDADGLKTLYLKFQVKITNNHKKPQNISLQTSASYCVSRLTGIKVPINYPLVWCDTQKYNSQPVTSLGYFELPLFKEGLEFSNMTFLEACPIEDKKCSVPEFFTEGGLLYFNILSEAGDKADEFGINYARSYSGDSDHRFWFYSIT